MGREENGVSLPEIEMKKEIQQKLKSLIQQGNFSYVDPHITAKNFPPPDKIQTKNWRIIRMGKTFSSEEALAYLKVQGCRPANLYELLALKNECVKELKPYERLLTFGRAPKISGSHRVPCVCADSGGDFGLDLAYFELGWSGADCLLSFCGSKSSEPLTPESSLPLELEINGMKYRRNGLLL